MKKITILLIIMSLLCTLCSCKTQNTTDSYLAWANKRQSEIDSQYQSEMNRIDKENCINNVLSSAYSEAESNYQAQKPTSSTQTQQSEKIVDTKGKQIWKIYIATGQMHFNGKFTGTGNFIVKLSDNNQNLVDLIANEIGDYVLDKTIQEPNGMYYLEVDYNDGKYNLSWN